MRLLTFLRWIPLFGGIGMLHAADPVGPLGPEAALRAFETEPGFEVELVAAEPLVVDPVAIAFDETERMYVVEGRDYPTGSVDGRPLGVVALLEDSDRDGQMDRRTEFATGILFPNGVMCWKNGVIVTAAPDVWWLADTDGDGRSDVKELLLTGFDTNTTSQLRVNDPTLGPDGWVYLAGGLRGGRITSMRKPGVVVDTEKGDLPFRPETGEIERIDGKSQFGLAFDAAGNRFACMNRIQSQHAPLPGRYLERNPHVMSPGSLHACPEIHENTLMTRYTAGAARYFPISGNITTADSHFGTYSAACAVHIDTGNFLPPEYRGAAFSCDPTGNLVRGDRLEKTGGTFAAVRIHEGTEALRSRDDWFRPVFLASGPDGALYVADMYRRTIEHPEYLPGEVRKQTDFEGGKGMGRIWRLRGRDGWRAPSGRRKVAKSDREWVEALGSDIPWVRDTAFRRLTERGSKDAMRMVAERWAHPANAASVALHLRLLANQGGLTEAILLRAMTHADPAVRRTAVLLAEPWLEGSAELRQAIFERVSDADSHVRFQVGLALGGMSGDPRSAGALAEVAMGAAPDRWTRAAVFSSVRGSGGALELLRMVLISTKRPAGATVLIEDLGRLIARSSGDAVDADLGKVHRTIPAAAVDDWLAAVGGFAEVSAEGVRSLLEREPEMAEARFRRAREVTADVSQPADLRRVCVRFLGFDRSAGGAGVLRERLRSAEAGEIQMASVTSLLRAGGAEVARKLVRASDWKGYGLAVRNALLQQLTERAEFATVLLDAVEAGTIPMGVLMPPQREALKRSKDSAISARAGRIFGDGVGDRRKAFDEARAALGLRPESAKGRAVFERSCAVCHRLNQQGIAVGPDLFDIRQQPKESILFHIVAPDAEIAPNFVNYECELRDGRVLTGLLVADSAAGITLRMAQGREEVLPRTEIVSLSASRLSLMPQELEKTMTLQELADLLAYLRGEP